MMTKISYNKQEAKAIPHPLGLHDKDYDDPAAKKCSMYMARIDLIILIPKWVLMGIICILYILIPYPLTVEEYQGRKSPLDSVTRKSGKNSLNCDIIKI